MTADMMIADAICRMSFNERQVVLVCLLYRYLIEMCSKLPVIAFFGVSVVSEETSNAFPTIVVTCHTSVFFHLYHGPPKTLKNILHVTSPKMALALW